MGKFHCAAGSMKGDWTGYSDHTSRVRSHSRISCWICPGPLSCRALSRIICVIAGSLPKRDPSRCCPRHCLHPLPIGSEYS